MTQAFHVTEQYAWFLREGALRHIQELDDFLVTKKRSIFHELPVAESDAQTQSLLALLPAPHLLKDSQKAAERIVMAMEKGEKITIFGDYDVDGTTSCAMLQMFFAALGTEVDIYIPDRLLEGYGLNSKGVEILAAQGTRVIVTVDNGISACTPCDLALSLGVDVIITDHHDVPPVLPNAYAILNPKQTSCTFPFPMIAGVGVAFYLMIAIRSLVKAKKPHLSLNLKDYLDYVAIGTIADMAPLTGVNHILCKVGLEVLDVHLKNDRRKGLLALLHMAGWKGLSAVDSVDVGFKIGPRLNAAGRLGNALKSVDLLLTQDEPRARELATFLHAENAERQLLEKKMTQEALQKATKASHLEALVLHQEDWHPGVVGLVASRVLDKFYRPVLVLGTLNGVLKGSGRSTHSFDLFGALNEVRHEFISFGGHFHAVGLTLEPHKLPWLEQYLDAKAREHILEQDKIKPLWIDGQLKIGEIDQSFVERFEQFEPYGIENPRTRWLIFRAQVRHIKRIGRDLTQGHAKVCLQDGDTTVWITAFGRADAFEQIFASGLEVQVVVEAKRGSWAGRDTVDMTVVDFAPVVSL